MPNLDVFKSDAFSVQTLTAAVNNRDRLPTKLNELRLFESGGVSTTQVWIEQQAGKLNFLQTSPRGAPAAQYLPDKRKAQHFNIPHVSLESTIYADQVQDVRQFGADSNLQTVQDQITKHLDEMSRQHDATLEFQRVGALKGEILDADGSVIYDLHDEFSTSQVERTFEFSNASAPIRSNCLDVTRSIEDELGAEPASGMHAFCGSDFFDALISHPDAKAAYERYQAGELLRNDPRAGFTYGGITFVEYRATVAGKPYFQPDECYAFPLGTSLFIERFAPADFLDTANTIGLPKYARIATDDALQRYVRLHTQCNGLPLCLRPNIVVKINAG